MSTARWRLVSKASWIARSSQCMCVTTAGQLIVYGGELRPRQPVDSADSLQEGVVEGSVHLFDLKRRSQTSGLTGGWRTLRPVDGSPPSSGPAVPKPRVGATMVCMDDCLYVWGGRGGVDMAPLDDEQVGVWRAELKTSSDTAEPDGVSWERLSYTEGPEPRSYHAATATDNDFFIHAGCPTSGRLAQLHKFNIRSRQWEELSSAPAPPRGGTGIVAKTLMSWGRVVLRFGGFSGYELPSVPGTLDLFDPKHDRWYTLQPSPDPIHGYPGARSVCGFAHFESKSPMLSSIVVVLFHGERDASTLGHAGAGTFWDDVWALKKTESNHVVQWAWRKLDVKPADEQGEGESGMPEGRGWFAHAGWQENGTTSVFMHGGLLSSNERSDELWELQIE